MEQYKQAFDSMMGVKTEPNEHEVALIQRGQKYISKLAKIPGIEMIAIVNSLSMYATHPESDIDLFIITRPRMIWFVRFFATILLWICGVWRRDADIAGNLCLSFFITTEAMDLSQIAIENDIYLYYWIYYMRPIYVQNETYEKFLSANSWVDVDEEQKRENKKFIEVYHLDDEIQDPNMPPFCHPDVGRICLCPISGTGADPSYLGMTKETEKNTKSMENGVGEINEDPETSSGPFQSEAWEGPEDIGMYKKINTLIRYFLLPRTLRTYEQLGRPEGIIISDQMLKFHDRDRRKEIRDQLI